MFQVEGKACAKVLREDDAYHLETGRVCHQIRKETGRTQVPQGVSRFSAESKRNKLQLV